MIVPNYSIRRFVAEQNPSATNLAANSQESLNNQPLENSLPWPSYGVVAFNNEYKVLYNARLIRYFLESGKYLFKSLFLSLSPLEFV